MQKQYDGLSDEDVANLNFLINATDEVLQDWKNYIDQDDLDYAVELLTILKYRILDIAVESSNLTQSKKILKKYSLK